MGQPGDVIFWRLIGSTTRYYLNHITIEEGKSASGLDQNYWFGLACVLISAISSGFTGVYFEKLLKTDK